MEHAANNDHLKDDQIKKTEEENLEQASSNEEVKLEKESPIPDPEPEVKEALEPLKEDSPKSDPILSDDSVNELTDSVEDEFSLVPDQSPDTKEIPDTDQAETPEIDKPEITDKDNSEVPKEKKPKNTEKQKAVSSPEDSAEVQESSVAKAKPVFPEEVERVDYKTLSREELVKFLDDLLANKSFEKIRNSVDEIHDVYSVKSDVELAEKKAKFISDGGLEQDFKPADDPINIKMIELLDKYKGLNSEHNKE
ncbi:MAG: hypothetical protein PF450_15975, partial [Bacteroidales bacterium]|nr:hypothetical protein [Bacteroidales bacterium]